MKKVFWNESMRLCRERHGYLQKELSEKLGISERTLQRYEAGESEPTVSILIKLSKIYDASIDSIIGNELSSSFDITKIERYIKEIETTCKTLRREMYDSDGDSIL